MKYKAIVMVPTVVEFENPGNQTHVKNQALALLDSYQTVKVGEEVFEPKLLGAYPVGSLPEQPLVFDPPPQVA